MRSRKMRSNWKVPINSTTKKLRQPSRVSNIVHKPDHDICVICLFQPGAFQPPLSDPSPQRVVKISSFVPRVPSRPVEISSQPPVPSRSTLLSPISTKELKIVPRVPAVIPPKMYYDYRCKSKLWRNHWPMEFLVHPLRSMDQRKKNRCTGESRLTGWFKRSWSKGTKY